MRHFIEPNSFSLAEQLALLDLADRMEADPAPYAHLCDGRILATLFYEPSTRTQMSFQTAMIRLGGSIIGFDNPGNSSVSKGENLKDTIKIVSNYADVLVMRHNQEGAARAAALSADCPVINAGDGGHLHPTQTLTDLLTLKTELGRLDNLTVGLCGDLKYGRTVHSILKALSCYKNNKFILISTPSLALPQYIKDVLHARGCEFKEAATIEEAIGECDMLYMTRIQQERFFNEEDYLRLKGCYQLDAKTLALAKPDTPVLHPLPRVNEITLEVDDDPRAAYFEQVQNAVYVRMALIMTLLGLKDPKAEKEGN